MRWLHFSDFHFKASSGPQDVAAGELLSYLRSFPLEKIDAVFLVGDIAYSGQATEYERFESTFLSPLRKLSALTDARIFAVPGNHDVDCEAADPITWDGIRTRKQAVFFNEDAAGKQARKNRSKVFTNYWDFVTRNDIYSPDPFNEITKVYGSELGFSADVIATNTSFFCDREEDSSAPITPCPLPSLRTHLNAMTRIRPMLLLGHHPHNCFRPSEQTQFTTLLIDKQLLYLHGHEHRPQLTSNVDGTIRSIGFGAAYITPLDQSSPAPYKNSFAVCEVSNRLFLSGHSWDSDIGRWDDVTRTQFYTGVMPDTVDGARISLRLPLLDDTDKRPTHTGASLREAPRRSPHPASVSLVSLPSERMWGRLFMLSENLPRQYRDKDTIDVQKTGAQEGKVELLVESAESRDLLVCIPGAGHMLTAKEVESYNTRLDTEDLSSVTVLSFGKVSADARAMYLRLKKSRKAIEIFANKDLAERSLLLISKLQASVLSQCDAAVTQSDILIDSDDIYLLLVRLGLSHHFSILDHNGEALPATHSVVVELRTRNSRFAKMAYEGDAPTLVTATAPTGFDEGEYLRQCYSENRAMAYSALALK